MRSLVASAFWLRTNLAWESRDAGRVRLLLDLTTSADGRPLYYWLNGARMLAYDLPEWRITESMPEAVRQKYRREGGRIALEFLARAQEIHARSPELLIEMANVNLRVLGDREEAARLFREAALQPGAPALAGRVHAELLRELGRPAEALAWLRVLLPTLPEDRPAARRAVVLERIKALEAELAGR